MSAEWDHIYLNLHTACLWYENPGLLTMLLIWDRRVCAIKFYSCQQYLINTWHLFFGKHTAAMHDLKSWISSQKYIQTRNPVLETLFDQAIWQNKDKVFITTDMTSKWSLKQSFLGEMFSIYNHYLMHCKVHKSPINTSF